MLVLLGVVLSAHAQPNPQIDNSQLQMSFW